MNRSFTITQKVRTAFGSIYIHILLDDTGVPVGGSISTPQKEPESQVSGLLDDLSRGLDEALRIAVAR